jgi:UDP-2,4-diacetamido-2,4,6-trideoxy-beta-L-altropyranose hydrolase
MKIVFYVKGGLRIGMGHVSRSIALADAIGDRAHIIFVTNRDKVVINYVKTFGYEVSPYRSNDKLVEHLKKLTPDILIIDKMEVEEGFAKSLKETINSKVVIIGNLSSANKYANVVVNSTSGGPSPNRKYTDNSTGTLFFTGPRYCILRKEFLEYKKLYKKKPPKIERIVLIFGGSDPSNLSSLVLDELLRSNKQYTIDVILGIKFKYFKEFYQVLESYPDKIKRVQVFRNINNVGELMYKADLVFCCFGATILESLCVGTPIISINQNSLQRMWSEGFLPTMDKSQINLIGDMINSGNYVNPDSELIINMEIGEGKDELIAAIIDSQATRF